MKRLSLDAVSTTLLPLVLLASQTLEGCAVAPIPMDTRVGPISVKERLPLKVAVFIPTPPGYRIFRSHSPSTSPNNQFPAAGPTEASRDITDQYPEALWPWGRELSKTSQEAFSQVFSQVTIVSQLPEAGQFDAVIQPMLTEIHKDYYGGATMWMELTLAWMLNVVDKNGTKMLSKKGVLPPHRMVDISINKSAFRSQEAFARDEGEVASEALALVVKEWAQKLVSSKELRDYATQLNKS